MKRINKGVRPFVLGSIGNAFACWPTYAVYTAMFSILMIHHNPRPCWLFVIHFSAHFWPITFVPTQFLNELSESPTTEFTLRTFLILSFIYEVIAQFRWVTLDSVSFDILWVLRWNSIATLPLKSINGFISQFMSSRTGESGPLLDMREIRINAQEGRTASEIWEPCSTFTSCSFLSLLTIS